MEGRGGDQEASPPQPPTTPPTPQISTCVNAIRTNPDAFACVLPCDYAAWRPAALAPVRSPLAALTLAAAALASAAAAHAADMAASALLTHAGSDEAGLGDRAAAAGFRSFPLGENIAGGYASVLAVSTAWACSAGHRDNMLACGYDTVGTGVAVATGGGGGGGSPSPASPSPSSPFSFYFVQDFGCSRPDYACACDPAAAAEAGPPPVDAPTCGGGAGAPPPTAQGGPASVGVPRPGARAPAPASVPSPPPPRNATAGDLNVVAPPAPAPAAQGPLAPARAPTSAPQTITPPPPATPPPPTTTTNCSACLYPLAMEVGTAQPVTSAATASVVASGGGGCGNGSGGDAVSAATDAAGARLPTSTTPLSPGMTLITVTHPASYAGPVTVAGGGSVLTYRVASRALVVTASGLAATPPVNARDSSEL